MQTDDRESSAEAAPRILAWNTSAETRDGPMADATLWLTGGASLLLWTAIALLLTSA